MRVKHALTRQMPFKTALMCLRAQVRKSAEQVEVVGGGGVGIMDSQFSLNSHFLHYEPLTFNSRVLQQRRHVNVVGMLFHERDVKRRLVEKVCVTCRFSLNLLLLSLNITDTRVQTVRSVGHVGIKLLHQK